MKVDGDFSGATRFNHMMMELEKSFMTNTHLTVAGDAAFAILERHFEIDTDLTAAGTDGAAEELAHVYDWGMEGTPAGRLWEVWLDGRGSNRHVTWDWLPSKVNVPIDPDDYPVQVPTEKLNPNHVFTWKAPILEYGTAVTVKPNQSSWLVIPYPDSIPTLGKGKYITDGKRSVLITNKPYTFTPGSEEQQDTIGHFTVWFTAWWETRAEAILEDIFEPRRDNKFVQAFREKVKHTKTTTRRRKTMTWSYDTKAAAQGARDAIEISNEVEQEYLRMVRDVR